MDGLLNNTDIHFACINDLDEKDAAVICRDRLNLFCLAEPMDFRDFFCRIQDRFIYLSEWEKSLSDAVLQDHDYQYLVDISEIILKNPIFIQGPDLYLLATSKNYPGSTEIQREYQKRRYHSAEFIARLKEHARLDFYKHHKEVLIMTDHKIEDYDVIGQSKVRKDELCLFAGVSCSVTPRSSYYVDLVTTFLKYVLLTEEREYIRVGSARKRGSDFIRNLISGELESESILSGSRNLLVPLLSLERFEERPLYSYREFFIRDIFQSYRRHGNNDIYSNAFVRALQLLIDYDRKHQRNLVEVLYYFLTSESNASKTAELIHMSRTNVQYNISRISALAGLSLEEHRTRFGLLIAYNLLGIYFV